MDKKPVRITAAKIYGMPRTRFEPVQTKRFDGKVYKFSGWMRSREAVKRFRSNSGLSVRSVRVRSVTGTIGYLVYTRSRR